MRVTIIPADRMVMVDGEARAPLAFAIDPAIHAVQWHGDWGEVEFIATSPGGKPPNEIITDMAPFQAAVDAWQAWMPPAPPPLPEPGPVAVVTMRQARLALLAAGLLDAVEAAVADAGRAVQIEWEYATVVERRSPLVAAIAAGLGLDDAAIDALFADAASR